MPDGTRDTVDDALGLAGTPNQSLSMLLVGHRRLNPVLLDFGIPDEAHSV